MPFRASARATAWGVETMTAPVMHDLEGFELYEPRTPQTVFKMKLPRYVPPMSFVRHAVSLSAKD